LQQAGIPTAYVQQISDTEILAKKCYMIPLEVIIRRYAVGSYLDRMPQFKREGTPYRFHRLKFELFLKTSKGILNDINLRDYLPEEKEELIKYLDAPKTLQNIQKKKPEIQNLMELDRDVLVEEVIKIIDDPWIENPYYPEWALAHPKKPTWTIPSLTRIDPIINLEMIKEIEELTRKTFLILEGAWNILGGYRLIDFKIEFGITESGNLVVADVIDNDSWRLRTADWKELSKQTFRDNHPLAQVQENYLRVAQLVEQFRIPKQAIILWRGSIKDDLEKFAEMPGIQYEDIVASGHKSSQKVVDQLNELHATYPEGAVIIPIVGMSNGLGPILSARTSWPVYSYCNSAKSNPEDIWSGLRMPSDVPHTIFLNIKNAYLAALDILAMKNPVAYMTRQYAIEQLDE
jgi:phosphoribosylaminoimidazole carboxylase/phosphoribosylaminoimidazole-succinocarboxamide synthase